MLLQLDDKFRVTADSSRQNWQLEALEDIKDKKTQAIKQDWRIVGYFGGNLKALLNRYKNEALINSNFSTLDNVLDKLQEIDRTISSRVKKENIKLDIKSDE